MSRAYFERLSTASASFLAAESSKTFCHSAVLGVFEPGLLSSEERGVDFEALRAGIEARLAQVPRARQRLRWTPVSDHPVWVDDPDFNLEYHLRHTSLPRPGSREQLERMVARIHAQRLDRNRPLWECWVLEGLEGGRFAMLWKTHHCMIDPTSEGDLLEALLSPHPDAALPPVTPYRPRPLPSALELGRDELTRRLSLPGRGGCGAGRRLAGGDWRHELERRARGVAKLLGYSIRPRTATPLSGPSGPHRRFTSLVHPLADAQRVRRALAVSLNDVLLAVLAGAIRSFFQERLVNPATVDFRVSVPVGLDTDSEGGEVGEWIVELPIWEKDPVERVERLRRQTRAAVSRRPADLVLLNLPGPQVPLYFRGARLLQAFAVAPLREDHALAVSVTSYDGQLCWGLNADFDRLPDLDRFAAAMGDAFAELMSEAARSEPPSAAEATR